MRFAKNSDNHDNNDGKYENNYNNDDYHNDENYCFNGDTDSYDIVTMLITMIVSL